MRDRLVEVLSSEPAVGFACLFGSRTTGRARADSDWDVAVYLDVALDRGARERVERDLRTRLSDLGASTSSS